MRTPSIYFLLGSLLFTIYYLLFTIYYLILNIYYLLFTSGKGTPRGIICISESEITVTLSRSNPSETNVSMLGISLRSEFRMIKILLWPLVLTTELSLGINLASNFNSLELKFSTEEFNMTLWIKLWSTTGLSLEGVYLSVRIYSK
jgi:hypothetical protein